MISVSIPQALKNMDGIFGCKVSFASGRDSDPCFMFSKKNILDFFCDIFSSNEEKSEQKSYAMHALRHIEQELKEGDGDEFKALIRKYENNDNLIDFRKIRSALRKISPSQLPPVVYMRKASKAAVIVKPERDNSKSTHDSGVEIAVADDNRELDKYLNYENIPEPVPARNCLQDLWDDPLIQTPTKLSAPKKLFPKGLGNSQSEKEECEKIYLYRVGESIRNKTYKVEIVRDVDGEVSDDNIEALAETIVAIENLTKKPILVICNEEDIGFDVLSKRLDSAFLDAVAELGNPYRCAQKIDMETAIKESNELYDQARTKPLNTDLPKLSFSLPVYRSI